MSSLSAGSIERLRPGDGTRLSALRRRALADAPDAFGNTLAEARRRSPEAWEALIEELPTFVWREADADLDIPELEMALELP
jgi:hypothetical protein